MNDQKKTKSRLIQELTEARQRLAQIADSRAPFQETADSDHPDESAYRALFENAGDAIFHIRKSILIDCNAEAIKMLHCDKADLIGRTLDELLPFLQPGGLSSKESFLARMKAAALNGPQFFKLRCLRYDQTPFDAEISLSRVRINGEWLFQEIVREIPKYGDAEDVLCESENKFRDLSEKSLVGVYLIQDWAFRYANPRLAEIFGYTVEEVVGGMGPKDVVLPEDWHIVRENIRRRIAGEMTSIHFVFRLITREREIRNVEVYGSRTTYLGKPAVIGTLLDITERRRNEERLRQAERKYRSIFENAVEGIFQSTPEGQLVAANPAHARMLGYESPEDLISSLTDVSRQFYVQPGRRVEFMRILDRDGLVQGFECEFYKKDGTTIWVSLNARQVRDSDDKTVFFEGTIEDITEKKKVENELRQLNEFNKAIIDHAPVAVFTLDKNGVFTSINPALATLSGLGERAGEKLIGFNWLKNPYTIQCGLARHIEAGLRGEPFQLWDFPFMTYRGDRNIFMDFKGVPLKDKNGEIEGLLCIIEETTDRVKTRAKLMQEAKVSAIGRLAAGIAHELNNPLGTLVAYSERAKSCLNKGADVERLKGYLTIIEEEAFRCKGVTTDILSLLQKEGLEITKLDINEALDSLLELLNTGQAKIIKEKDLTLPRIMGDVSALRQVFVNLIANSVDAVEGRANATIWVRTKRGEDRVVVEIEDNGTGIPDSIVDKIFEPFFTTKESKSGIGLGLSLCYDLVRDMGGTIQVVSTPGHGTTFSVSFLPETL